MLSLMEYGLGKMLIGISEFGDFLSEFTFDTLEDEPELKYDEEELNVQNVDDNQYNKIDYLTTFDKCFSESSKSEGIKYYVLDKIKSYNCNSNDISGVIQDDIEHIISIEIHDDKTIESSCTCDEHNCKHIYAILLKYVDTEINKNYKIYYLFKTKYLLKQFRNLYNKIVTKVNLKDNIDLHMKIRIYDKLIDSYLERKPSFDLYNEIEGHYNNLKDILVKIDKDLYNKIIIDIEFIDHDVCSEIYKELVNEEYIEDFSIDSLN